MSAAAPATPREGTAALAAARARTAGLAMAALSQLLWGNYTVLTRHLQTNAHMPTLMFLTLACGVSMALGTVLNVIPEISRRWQCCRKQSYQQLEGPSRSASPAAAASCWHATRSVFASNRFTALFALLVLVRTLTNIWSTKFTLAVYAQLINLLTPFFVAFLSKFLYRDRLPRFTAPALLVAVGGALLVLLGPYATARSGGDAGGDGEHAGLYLTANDGYGVLLALVSTAMLSGYMVCLRKLPAAMSDPIRTFIQMMTPFTVVAPISFAVDDYTMLGRMLPRDLVILGCFIVFVWYLGNAMQTTAVRAVGAPLVATLMPSRLVIAMVMSSVALGEHMNALQICGGAVVIVAVSVYLIAQKKDKDRAAAAAAATAAASATAAAATAAATAVKSDEPEAGEADAATAADIADLELQPLGARAHPQAATSGVTEHERVGLIDNDTPDRAGDREFVRPRDQG